MRVEAKLTQTEDGQQRIGKSKDRIDHWTAKSGEAIIADQGQQEMFDGVQDGEMMPEADDTNMQEGNVETEAEQFFAHSDWRRFFSRSEY